MVALTYGDARVATPETATKTVAVAAPQQGFFARFFAAMMESRMRQAEREIRLYAPQIYPLLREETKTPRGGW